MCNGNYKLIELYHIIIEYCKNNIHYLTYNTFSKRGIVHAAIMKANSCTITQRNFKVQLSGQVSQLYEKNRKNKKNWEETRNDSK